MENSHPSAISRPEQWVQLRPGVSFCSVDDLNRISRQQGFCKAIAEAWVLDEIHQAIPLNNTIEHALIHIYLEQEGISDDETLEYYLQQKRWDHIDLNYFATKEHRIQLFKERAFRHDVELHFLENKLDRDQVEYSLIRTQDENLAFELHQRLVEGEASFAELAVAYSEGPERKHQGRFGPVPLSQAHPVVAEKLRISDSGQLWPPFFLVNIWLILRLDQHHRARLDDDCRNSLIDELFETWRSERVQQLLQGETPAPLPLHLLKEEPSQLSEQA